jgi:hypothetical protein
MLKRCPEKGPAKSSRPCRARDAYYKREKKVDVWR